MSASLVATLKKNHPVLINTNIDENASPTPSASVSIEDFNNIFHEVPSGAVNGVNKVFTVSHDYINGKISIYLNGLQQPETTYTETSPTSFTLADAPVTGTTILVDYLAVKF